MIARLCLISNSFKMEDLMKAMNLAKRDELIMNGCFALVGNQINFRAKNAFLFIELMDN